MSKKKKTTDTKLLTKYLRQIGEEVTELIVNKDGEDVMATKMEAMARLIWKDALGYADEQGKKIRPNRTAQNLIYERLEGRVPNATVDKTDKPTAADRVTEQGKDRITKAGGLSGTSND